MTKNCMFLLQIAIVRILYMADATLPSSSSSLALASLSSLSLSHRVTFQNLQQHLQKVNGKNAQRGIYWRQVLAIVSPQINFRTKIGLHFRESRKKLYPSPFFWFLRDAHKANEFFLFALSFCSLFCSYFIFCFSI